MGNIKRPGTPVLATIILAASALLLWRDAPASSLSTSAGLLLSATVTLTPAQVAATDITPFVLVPTPGVNKVLFPFAIRWRLQPGPMNLPYVAENDALYMWWNNNANAFDYIQTAQGGLTFANGIINTDTAYFANGLTPAVGQNGASTAAYTNVPLTLQPIAGDSLNRGAILTAVPVACGTGYAVNDQFTINGFTGYDAQLSVSGISGGGCVTSISIDSPGVSSAKATAASTTNVRNISSSTLNMGGLGYAMGDTFTVDGSGDGVAAGVVDTVGAMGVVTAYHLTDPGNTYTTTTGETTMATSGIGTGLTLNIVAGVGTGLTVTTTVLAGDGTLTVTVWYTVAPK